MTSRDKILKRVQEHQPPSLMKNLTTLTALTFDNPVTKFSETLKSLGGALINITNVSEIDPYLKNIYGTSGRVVSSIATMPHSELSNHSHEYADVLIYIMNGIVGVAENGAIWVTDKMMADRALPFICEHLAIVLSEKNVVSNMMQAYNVIDSQYDYGTFISGPSKTADIEQSLVLGAHGPKSLTVFLLR